MDRRSFIRSSSAAAAALPALAAPAIAQAAPEIKWRMTSSFPKTLDILYSTAETFTKYVAEATDNKFQIQLFPAGEIAPALEAANEVGRGSIEMAQTASYYYWGKDPAFACGTGLPFSLNARQQNGWMYYGGGIQMMNDFYAGHNLIGFPAGNTGAQMGGWFRKEINSVDDLKGLKFRIGGFGGAVISKLGVVPQQLAGADVYPALEKGTIDAAEFVGPADDEKLGLYKVAKYYYYPGWWEGGAMLHHMVNLEKWNSLPKNYQAIVEAGCAMANVSMLANYDAKNPAALKRLVASGAVLRPFPQDVMAACFEATKESCTEIAGKNPVFRAMYDSLMAYRADAYLWQQVSEATFDNFMMAQQRKKNL
jgi:TRAP-type mannitol/chloroaromatic compound transport system substrate-binding protein